jgi:hypothetical protein
VGYIDAMPSLGRRAFDPPFPRAIRLLGRARSLVAEPRLPYAARRRMLAVLRAAAAKLEADAAAGRLSADDRRHLSALAGFRFAGGRSGQWRGVFIVGLADVRLSRDPEYWASALVHDGVHAWRQLRGRPFRDEVGPCEAQIGYLTRAGADPALVAHIAAFRDDVLRRRRRLAQA